MAQTTGAVSARNSVLEMSTNGTAWTDISGFATSIEPGESARQFEETYTFDGDAPIVTTGKKESVEITAKVVYTEGSTDAFEVVRAAFENQTPVYFRWAPKGTATGNFRFTTSEGKVLTFKYPMLDASSAEAIPCELTIRCSSITKSVIP